MRELDLAQKSDKPTRARSSTSGRSSLQREFAKQRIETQIRLKSLTKEVQAQVQAQIMQELGEKSAEQLGLDSFDLHNVEITFDVEPVESSTPNAKPALSAKEVQHAVELPSSVNLLQVFDSRSSERYCVRPRSDIDLCMVTTKMPTQTIGDESKKARLVDSSSQTERQNNIDDINHIIGDKTFSSGYYQDSALNDDDSGVDNTHDNFDSKSSQVYSRDNKHNNSVARYNNVPAQLRIKGTSSLLERIYPNSGFHRLTSDEPQAPPPFFPASQQAYHVDHFQDDFVEQMRGHRGEQKLAKEADDDEDHNSDLQAMKQNIKSARNIGRFG